jgi:hypothetical protein
VAVPTRAPLRSKELGLGQQAWVEGTMPIRLPQVGPPWQSPTRAKLPHDPSERRSAYVPESDRSTSACTNRIGMAGTDTLRSTHQHSHAPIASLFPGNHAPPDKKTNPSSGWSFFAHCRVFAGVRAGSCGFRRFARAPEFGRFHSLQGILLSASNSVEGPKSTSDPN